MSPIGIIILCIVVLLFIAAFATIRMFNKLTIKKIVSEGKYVDLDEAFIRRYEALPELLELVGGGEAVASERQAAIDAKRAEERVEHDKLMAAALSELLAEKADALSSGRGAELCETLSALESEIADKYAKYNEATEEYENLRKTPIMKPVVKFFSFEEKPLF
ncbi:MAG: LemA family protein [Clostridia bacterium]|nr:LemA family protein [Clostridia bacterium]